MAYPGQFITPQTTAPFTETVGAETSAIVDIMQDPNRPDYFYTTLQDQEMNDSIIGSQDGSKFALTNKISGQTVSRLEMGNRRGALGVPHDGLYPVNATPAKKGLLLINKIGDIDVINYETSLAMPALVQSNAERLRRGVVQSIDDMFLFGKNKIDFTEIQGVTTAPKTIQDNITTNTAFTAEQFIEQLLAIKGKAVVVVENEMAIPQILASLQSANPSYYTMLSTLLGGVTVKYYHDLTEQLQLSGIPVPTKVPPYLIYDRNQASMVLNPNVEIMVSQHATLENAQLNGAAAQQLSLYQRNKTAFRITSFAGYEWEALNNQSAFSNIVIPSETPDD
ncbi:hypothetical protein [Lactococcus allomyrinae]|uniref:Phage major capsid protein n=1 Tax=Lactococcus allomyrinae TaxID=2419773 RepID=A0A387BCU5_9LACT|nr:hypothetical protein [Lactococcus allomyrinae]AYG01705.1 hypothetical protein D7I46_11960 [Lactococcus allomyrinae]